MEFDCWAFFKAVADQSRSKMMLLLHDKGELSVSEIGKHFTMKQPSISHHLGILKKAKIVVSRKDGKEVYYQLNPCCISSCCGDFMDMFKKKAGKTGA